MNPPKIAIIILNWNKSTDTISCVRALQQSDYANNDIIIVDNNSSSRDTNKIQKTFPRLTVIRNKKNLGFCKGNNIGIRFALKNNPDYIFLLNNDATVDPTALSHLVKNMQEHPDIGIMGSVIKYLKEPHKTELTGGNVNLKTGKATIFPSESYKTGTNVIETDWVSGCAFFIRTNLIHKFGYLDEWYFAYREEIDYCVRAKKNGYLIAFCTNAIVYHNRSERATLRQEYFKTRNIPYFMFKHSARKDLFIYFFKHYLYRTVARKIAYAFKDKNPYKMAAVLLGFLDLVFLRFGKGSLYTIELLSKIKSKREQKDYTDK